MNEDFERFTCPICGKKFTIYCDREMYGWQFKEDIYCSYTCMRVDEKEYLDSFNSGRLSLSEEYRATWLELMDWKVALKRYRALVKLKSIEEGLKNNEKLNMEIRASARLCSAYRFKYEDKLSLLSKSEHRFFNRFITSGWSTSRTMKVLKITREEGCDIAKDICKKLKKRDYNETTLRRVIGVNA